MSTGNVVWGHGRWCCYKLAFCAFVVLFLDHWSWYCFNMLLEDLVCFDTRTYCINKYSRFPFFEMVPSDAFCFIFHVLFLLFEHSASFTDSICILLIHVSKSTILSLGPSFSHFCGDRGASCHPAVVSCSGFEPLCLAMFWPSRSW